MEKVLKLPELKSATGLGKTAIYDLMQEGGFPRPIRLSQRAVGWISSEIEQWLAARPRSTGGRAGTAKLQGAEMAAAAGTVKARGQS